MATSPRMLGRLALRYARRHRVQTVRAVLGLLVVSLVLTTGLGLGDSLGASLERSVEERYGPIEVVARPPAPIAQDVADNVTRAAAQEGAQGTASLVVTGSVSNLRTQRAEAFASLRGMAADEPTALGPLPGSAPEPRPGEVVLSQTLADRLDAQVGDALRLRALPPGFNATSALRTTEANGTAGPGAPGQSAFEVGQGALGFLALVEAARPDGAAGEALPPAALRVRAIAPDGTEHPAQAGADGHEVRVLGQPATGTWRLVVEAEAPTAWQARILVGTTPPDLQALVVVLDATVSAIVPSQGRAAIAPRPSALVDLAWLQDGLQANGTVSTLYFAASDGPAAAERIHQMPEAGNGTASAWRVDAAKADAFRRVREDAGELTGFVLVMGGFTIVASMLLAYVLFSSLVEERRAELGIARAVGLTRTEVASTMVLEALAYAAMAALVGVLLGIGVVYALIEAIDAYARQFGAPEFFLHFDTWTLPLAFLGGALIPVATIAAGSVRFSRLDPARAIRGAPDDVRVHRTPLLGLGVALLALAALLAIAPVWRTLAYGIAAIGAATVLLAARRRVWAIAAAALGIAATVWSLYTFEAFPPDQRELDPVLTMARALLVTILASIVVACSPRPLQAAGPLLGRVRALRRAAYVALRYMGSRRVQAGLTTAMVAVVAVIVTAMGTLAGVFSQAIPTQEAGYDILGQSPFPFTTFPGAPPEPDAIAAAQFIPVHSPLGGARLRHDGEAFREGRNIRFAGVTPQFAAQQEYELRDRADAYPTDAAAWQAVAQGQAIIVPSWYTGPGELEVGDRLEVQTARGWTNYTIAAAQGDARRNEVWMAYDDVRSMGFPQSTNVLLRVAPGHDPGHVAHALTDAFQDSGLAFASVAEEAAEAADVLRATVLVLQSFLFLGVFVGVSSTGFLASRAVHERMREVGTLRAIGYEPADVRRAFMAESVAVCTVGLVVGCAVGLTVAHAMWWRSLRDVGAFEVPWLVLAAFAALVLGLTALASWAPARRAARLEPALALRTLE